MISFFCLFILFSFHVKLYPSFPSAHLRNTGRVSSVRSRRGGGRMQVLLSAKRDRKVANKSHPEADDSYNVQQLQGEFHVLPPCEAYRELCHRHQCKPINTVAKLFSSRIGEWNATTHLDFSRSYIGPKGVHPVVEMCKRLPALRVFNCADNYLTNNSVYLITRMAMFHPGLEQLELSGNEYISWTGGNFLSELALSNNNIREIGILHTTIPVDVAEDIFQQTRRNCVLSYQAMDRPPKPSRHPDAIYVRSMKRLFMEKQENGMAPASVLVDGHRERLRMFGMEHDITLYTETYYNDLCRRAPQDKISWEAFLIILMLDGSVYNEQVVKRLLNVFLEFNMEPKAGVEGFVDARDLAAIYARLYGERPSPSDVEKMYGVLELNDTMTLQWGEFLLLMYNRDVRDMSYSMNLRLTRAHHPTRMLHF
uniref:Uncharacterized protein TCIL3000_1_300 n=1 Tax=Trypanosoma congolense (strain IL3000) TaxID=1068625 RepID=G0UIS2_TRYCI|nr:unnamed protein product [Trypanosoma congolense IL3000]